MKVNIHLYGNANKEAGWNSQAFELEAPHSRIIDAFQSAKLPDGRTLADLVASDDWLKDSYAIFVSGRLLNHPTDLRMEIKDGDELLILDFPFTLGGG